MLSPPEVIAEVKNMLAIRNAEREKLDLLHRYWRGRQPYPIVPLGIPAEVRRLAEMSRANLIGLVIEVLTQSLSVEGFRAPREADNAEAWMIWQANKMDARQIGVHRASAAYGASYVTIMPGDPVPVLRGASPRSLTAAYSLDDDEWPQLALEVRRGGKVTEFRLLDAEARYVVRDESLNYVSGSHVADDNLSLNAKVVRIDAHDMGVCPVVRFLNHQDLDDDCAWQGEVEPLIPIQDQIDWTTFGLRVTEFYQAFIQRYIIGWTSPDETTKAKASASRLLTFDDPDVKVGEFGQADLHGYIDSRQSSIELMATISQTPPHNLLGKLVNINSDTLAAAGAGQERKKDERKRSWGESHEQMLRKAAERQGLKVPEDAQVFWGDTEARTLAATVDALGKLTQMLGVPPQELWERVPGVSQQDVERWRAAAESGDSLANLTAMLDSQSAPATDPSAELRAKADAMGVLIRSGASPESAAAQVGLAGLEFTGAVPTSLRLPTEEASQLEGASSGGGF